ncbi:MAG: SprT-like domain-containing protein [Bryobacteraceae bacterium]
MLHVGKVEVETALLFETPEQIFARVFRALRPRTPLPEIRIEFRRFANANSFARLQDHCLHVRIADLLAEAPAPVLESLAHILLSKLFRRPVPKIYAHRYRLYLNRTDVRRTIDAVRLQRGRKAADQPQGAHYNLLEIFEELNLRYFHGLMARPSLAWSARVSRTILGRYDPAHNAIILSRLLDSPRVPRRVVAYLLYHEMLHLRFPVQHRNGRRRVHTAEFKEAERRFEGLKEVRRYLKTAL